MPLGKCQYKTSDTSSRLKGKGFQCGEDETDCLDDEWGKWIQIRSNKNKFQQRNPETKNFLCSALSSVDLITLFCFLVFWPIWSCLGYYIISIVANRRHENMIKEQMGLWDRIFYTWNQVQKLSKLLWSSIWCSALALLLVLSVRRLKLPSLDCSRKLLHNFCAFFSIIWKFSIIC